MPPHCQQNTKATKNPGKLIFDKPTTLRELPEEDFKKIPKKLISKRENAPGTREEFDLFVQRSQYKNFWHIPTGTSFPLFMNLFTEKEKIPRDNIIFHSKHKTNLITRTNNILRKLKTEFRNNENINMNALQQAGHWYINGQFREPEDKSVFYFNDYGATAIAFFKSVLKEDFIVKLESLFLEAYELRMKESEKENRTIYTGLWAKMNPMNYLTKNNNAASGQFIIRQILPLLSPIASKFLKIVHNETYKCFQDLPKNAKINDDLFPMSATNFLEKNYKHRVTKAHKDTDDLKMTIIFPFHLSAPLKLPNQNISFNTQRGDIVMFMGCDFAHQVESAKLEKSDRFGKRIRTTFVLFGHKSLTHKPIYHLPKKEALEKYYKEYPKTKP